MGYPHPKAPASLVPRGVGVELQPARRPKGGWEAGTRIVSVVLAMLLAVTMLPAAGLSPAFADEPVERPATSGGDVALESTNGAATEARVAPVAEEREGGTLAADGLVYAVTDGGLAFVGFDGAAPEGALSVPAAVSVDGEETPVVAIDLAEGQVADKVTILSLPQGIKDVNTASLAPTFPSLASVEVASAASSLPVATGAASVRAAYSTSGGMLFHPTTIAVQNDDGSIESIECKELVWAPPALVSARIPVECRAIAEGAFADVRELKTVVAFGTMERISDGAFSTEQMEAAKVVVPQASAAVTDSERVSASMALMNDAGQKERRSAWHEAGWRTDDIVMGKPYGSLTETIGVTEEGTAETNEAMLVSYPGAHENAMDLKKPNAEGVIEQAENGLAFTVKSDMTAIVTWQGDKTATPSHLDIPASVVIDNVTYPVTEIAPNAFEGAVFLASVTIPEGVTAIGQDAFKDCANLAEPVLPSTLRGMAETTSNDAPEPMASETNHPTPSQAVEGEAMEASPEESAIISDGSISPYGTTNPILTVYVNPLIATQLSFGSHSNTTTTIKNSSYFEINCGNSGTVTWGLLVNPANYVEITAFNMNATTVAHVYVYPPTGWRVTSAGFSGRPLAGESVAIQEWAHITMVRDEAMGSHPLLTTNSFAGTGSQTTAARSDHNHDSTYLKSSAVSSYNTNAKLDAKFNTKLDSSAVSNYNTNAKLDAKFDTKVDASDFGTITYSGLDGSDASVYPTSYRKGGTPALPAPVREGYRFTGWTWGGQGSPTTDANVIKGAFANAGTVALTANWEVAAPEGNCFFADAALDSATGGAWESVIAVKLTDDTSKTSVSGIVLVPNDSTGLLKKTQDGALPDVRFALGGSPSSLTTTVGFNGAQTSSIGLVDVDGGKGIYVKITIPANGIDANRVVGMQTAESYIASLARMTYASIA